MSSDLLRILSIDDEDRLLQQEIRRVLNARWSVDLAKSLKEGLKRLREKSYDVLLLDHHLGAGSATGLEALPSIKAEFPKLAILMVTTADDIAGIDLALNVGAVDYIIKSKTAVTELLIRIPAAVSKIRRDHKLSLCENELDRILNNELVGQSDFIFQTKRTLVDQKGSHQPLLITGETGTGKEVIARAAWLLEGKNRPFVALNVAALPKSTMESDLFGHTPGAFTGAVSRRLGAIRSAENGTLFLDEIGELSLDAQSKLLRALETKEVLPLGEDRPISVKFRVIAATNRNLEEEISQGRFREDLYYRLNVIRIATQPLRNRQEDIGDLVKHHLRREWAGQVTLSETALKFAMAQPWPGNVRQLFNAVNVAAATIRAVGRDQIDVADLIRASRGAQLKKPNSDLQLMSMPETFGQMSPEDYQNFLANSERAYIKAALRLSGGNIQTTAQQLGLAKSTLYAKLKTLELDPDQHGANPGLAVRLPQKGVSDESKKDFEKADGS